MTIKKIFILLIITTHSLFAQKDEEKAVKACFDTYKAAIIEGRGGDAAEVSSQKTINYYQTLLDVILNGDSTTVAGQGIMEKITIFSIRHAVPKSQIENLDGKAFLEYAINRGLVGKESIQQLEIGTPSIAPDKATAPVMNNGMAMPISFDFYKEADAWKIDITSIIPATGKALQQMIDQSGMSEETVLFQILKSQTGEATDKSVWHPMN